MALVLGRGGSDTVLGGGWEWHLYLRRVGVALVPGGGGSGTGIFSAWCCSHGSECGACNVGGVWCWPFLNFRKWKFDFQGKHVLFPV